MRRTQTLSALLVLALLPPVCLAASGGKASGEGSLSSTDLDQTAATDRFRPAHAYAWRESQRQKRKTLVYLFDREVPADAWRDAEDRPAAITAWTIANKAPVVRWTLNEDEQALSVESCTAEGTCRASGNGVMNGVAELVATMKSDAGGHLGGTLEQGQGACGEKWCSVVSSYSVDLVLAPDTLRDRVATSGGADSADGPAARQALTKYWQSAGAAAKSDDLLAYFSTERSQATRDQQARNGRSYESMFASFFVPAHGGKLEIGEMRFLGSAALARVKTVVGSGDRAYEMTCGVLLRKESGNWKIGAEDC